MTNKTITDLPAAASLAGAEPIETVQSGVSVKTTAQDIADLGASPSVSGTWTPDLRFGGDNTGITYATDGLAGSYVKVGGIITVTFYLDLTSKGTATGNASIEGLPYSSADPGVPGAWAGAFHDYALGGAAQVRPIVSIGPSFNVLTLRQALDNSTDLLTDAAFTNTSVLEGSITYQAGAPSP